MKPHFQLRLFSWAFLIATLAACGPVSPEPAAPQATGCTTGVAQIHVGDGSMSTLCGCQEGSRTVTVASKSQLSCTVNSGTDVYFMFQGAVTSHQILPVGAPAMPGSIITVPGTATANVPFVFHTSARGNFQFQDGYDVGLAGTISVN